MEKYEFTHIIDFMFKNKEKFINVSDIDKERNFFIINRKLAREYPDHAEFFNTKNSDKATALDIWFSFFHKNRTNNIPKWYWFKKNKTESISSIIKKDEIKYIMEFYDIEESDVMYLIRNHTDDIKLFVKKLRKFNKK